MALKRTHARMHAYTHTRTHALAVGDTHANRAFRTCIGENARERVHQPMVGSDSSSRSSSRSSICMPKLANQTRRFCECEVLEADGLLHLVPPLRAIRVSRRAVQLLFLSSALSANTTVSR